MSLLSLSAAGQDQAPGREGKRHELRSHHRVAGLDRLKVALLGLRLDETCRRRTERDDRSFAVDQRDELDDTKRDPRGNDENRALSEGRHERSLPRSTPPTSQDPLTIAVSLR